MNHRLLSIDVLRGMTIFFMIIVNTPGTWEHVYAPLQHAKWNGWTPTDLVFPFFVFIVGLSMSFSMKNYQADQSALIRKILIRTLLIFTVGLILNWYPFYNKSIHDLRIFGVLQRIALAYGLGALITVFAKDRFIPFILASILLGYWVMLVFAGGSDPLSLENNLVRIIDLRLFGENHIYHGYGIPFDPEGLLSTIPTVGNVLIGYLVGKMIQSKHENAHRIKVLGLYGILLVILGHLWQFFGFPINKPIWSSSYVLLSSGLAMLFFLILIWLIDVRNWKKWTYVFQAFGLNPLISYVLSGLIIKTLFLVKIGDQNIYAWLYTHLFQVAFGSYLGSLMQAVTYVFFIWLFAWQLFIRKIVIKL